MTSNLLSRDLSERMISPFTSRSFLLEPLASPSDTLDCFQPHVLIPECYKLRKPFEATPALVKKASDKVLFYMFYNLTHERQQIEAAGALKQRGWKFNDSNMRWYKKESRSYVMFDPSRWEVVGVQPSNSS
jgi:hypothetical protein